MLLPPVPWAIPRGPWPNIPAPEGPSPAAASRLFKEGFELAPEATPEPVPGAEGKPVPGAVKEPVGPAVTTTVGAGVLLTIPLPSPSPRPSPRPELGGSVAAAAADPWPVTILLTLWMMASRPVLAPGGLTPTPLPLPLPLPATMGLAVVVPAIWMALAKSSQLPPTAEVWVVGNEAVELTATKRTLTAT